MSPRVSRTSSPVWKQKELVALLNLLVPLKDAPPEEAGVLSYSRMRHTHIHTYIPTEDSTSTPSDVDLYLWSFCKNINGKWIFFPIILQMWQKDKKQNKPKLPHGDLYVMSTYQRGDFHILQSSRLYQFSSNSNLQIQTFLCDTNITKTTVANKMENK